MAKLKSLVLKSLNPPPPPPYTSPPFTLLTVLSNKKARLHIVHFSSLMFEHIRITAAAVAMSSIVLLNNVEKVLKTVL